MSKTEINLDEISIDFSKHAGYNGPIESASDLFDQDGIYKFKLQNYVPFLSGKDGDPAESRKFMARLNFVCLDDDARGRKAIHNVHLSGVDKNGEQLNRQLLDVLVAGGFELSKVASYAEKGASTSVKTLLEALQTKYSEVYFDVERSEYQGKPTTQLTRPVTAEKAKLAIEGGFHRRAIVAPTAGASKPSNLGGPSAKPNGATSAAKNIDI